MTFVITFLFLFSWLIESHTIGVMVLGNEAYSGSTTEPL